jgi:hypothetical protein
MKEQYLPQGAVQPSVNTDAGAWGWAEGRRAQACPSGLGNRRAHSYKQTPAPDTMGAKEEEPTGAKGSGAQQDREWQMPAASASPGGRRTGSVSMPRTGQQR